MSKSRSLSLEENSRVCEAVRTLRKAYPNQTALARDLILPDGRNVSQTSVSDALNGLPVGMAFARAVAAKLGISFEELVGAKDAQGPGSVLRYHDLAGWKEASEDAVGRGWAPNFAALGVGRCPVAFSVERVDASFVAQLAWLWMNYASKDVVRATEAAEVQDQRVQFGEAQAEHYGGVFRSGGVRREDVEHAEERGSGVVASVSPARMGR